MSHLGDLPNPGFEPTFPTSLGLAGAFFSTSATWEASGTTGTGILENMVQSRARYSTLQIWSWPMRLQVFRSIVVIWATGAVCLGRWCSELSPMSPVQGQPHV